jgi:hypothetical protein
VRRLAAALLGLAVACGGSGPDGDAIDAATPDAARPDAAVVRAAIEGSIDFEGDVRPVVSGHAGLTTAIARYAFTAQTTEPGTCDAACGRLNLGWDADTAAGTTVSCATGGGGTASVSLDAHVYQIEDGACGFTVEAVGEVDGAVVITGLLAMLDEAGTPEVLVVAAERLQLPRDADQ